MSFARGVLWFFGIALVAVAVVLVAMQTGLAWAPYILGGVGLVIVAALLLTARSANQRHTQRATPASVTVVETYRPSARPARRRVYTAQAETEAPAAEQPTAVTLPPVAPGTTQYTGIARSALRQPDGSIVQGTVRTDSVVQRTSSGRKQVVTRKTKSISRRPVRGVRRTHTTTRRVTRRSR
ncbi:MAG: hypothetical protein V4510_09320 [bacterium]